MIFLNDYRTELIEYVNEQKHLFQMLANKTILISGAAGLIGSYIVDLCIVANAECNFDIKIYALDRDEKRLIERFPTDFNQTINRLTLDVAKDDIDAKNIDYIIHAASNTSPIDYALKPVDTIKTNIYGTDKLINLCIKEKSQRFVS